MMVPYPSCKSTTAEQIGAKHAVVYMNKADTMQNSEMVGDNTAGDPEAVHLVWL